MQKILFVGLAILLTACSIKDKAEQGMVLHIASIAKPKGMDPIYTEDLYSNTMVVRVYESLLQYHPLKRPYVLEPLLATEMPAVSKDGLTYTFKIRQGVKFHNDPAFPDGKGRELVAEDFVYSMKRLADPATAATGWWLLEKRVVGLDAWREESQKNKTTNYDAKVEGLQAKDKYTLQIKLLKPFPQFLYALTMPYTAAVPREAVDKYGKEFINHAVGTGPFILETFKPAEIVTYVKNPNYWHATYPTEGAPGDKEKGLLNDAGKTIPFVDRIESRIIVEDQPRWMHFVKGDLDFSSVPKDNFKQAIVKTGDDVKLTEEFKKKDMQLEVESSLDLTYTAFNLESEDVPQFKDKRVRQAISLALDEKEGIDLFFNGMAMEAQTVIPPNISGHDNSYKNPYRTGDVEKAKKLLAAAGFPDGKGLPEITYDTLADTNSRQMYDYVAKQLIRIGVKLKMNGNTWPALLERIQKRKVQLWGVAWGADYPDAENFLQLFYGPNAQPGGMNGSYYKNKEFDHIFEKARLMKDSPARTKLYRQLSMILAEDCPVVLGLHRKAVGLLQPWLRNYKYQEFTTNQAKYLRIDTELKKKYKQ